MLRNRNKLIDARRFLQGYCPAAQIPHQSLWHRRGYRRGRNTSSIKQIGDPVIAHIADMVVPDAQQKFAWSIKAEAKAPQLSLRSKRDAGTKPRREATHAVPRETQRKHIDIPVDIRRRGAQPNDVEDSFAVQPRESPKRWQDIQRGKCRNLTVEIGIAPAKLEIGMGLKVTGKSRGTA